MSLEDIDTIVDDYFYLIKKVRRKKLCFKKPRTVALTDDMMIVLVDGEEYDFDFEIPHNDRKGTESKMEIEALYSPRVMQEIVQDRLSRKFI